MSGLFCARPSGERPRPLSPTPSQALWPWPRCRGRLAFEIGIGKIRHGATHLPRRRQPDHPRQPDSGARRSGRRARARHGRDRNRRRRLARGPCRRVAAPDRGPVPQGRLRPGRAQGMPRPAGRTARGGAEQLRQLGHPWPAAWRSVPTRCSTSPGISRPSSSTAPNRLPPDRVQEKRGPKAPFRCEREALSAPRRSACAHRSCRCRASARRS